MGSRGRVAALSILVFLLISLAVQVDAESSERRLRTSKKTLRAHLRSLVHSKTRQDAYPLFDESQVVVPGLVNDHPFNDLAEELNVVEHEATQDPEAGVSVPLRPLHFTPQDEHLKPFGLKAWQAFRSDLFADIRAVFKKATTFVRAVQQGDCVLLPQAKQPSPGINLQYGIVEYVSRDTVVRDIWRVQVTPAVGVREVTSCSDTNKYAENAFYDASAVRVTWKSTFIKVKRAAAVVAKHLQASALDLGAAIFSGANIGSVWLTAGVGVKTGLIPTHTLGALLKSDVPNGASASLGILVYPFTSFGQIYEFGVDWGTDEATELIKAEIAVGLKFSIDAPTTKFMERGCDGFGIAMGIDVMPGSFSLDISLDGAQTASEVQLSGVSFSFTFDATSLIPGYNALEAAVEAASFPVSFSTMRGCSIQVNPGIKGALSNALGWLRRVPATP